MLECEIEPTGYEGYGGVRECDFEGWVKSKRPSPCVQCPGICHDKLICTDICEDLEKWQDEDEGTRPVFVVKTVDLVESAEDACPVCGEGLVYEDETLYCGRCLKVVMRFDSVGRGKDLVMAIKALLLKGWGAEEIARLVGKTVDEVVTIERKMNNRGVRKRGLSDAQKKEVVDEVVKCGCQKAARKFGLHPETVARFAREAGRGKKQRLAKKRKEKPNI